MKINITSNQQHPKNYHFIIIGLLIAVLTLSIITFSYIYELKKALLPKTIDSNDFLSKLTSHNEMKAYLGVAPLNIIEINKGNLANLQGQIEGLDSSYIGSFIIQYSDRIAIFDYYKDSIKGTLNFQQPQKAQLPQDFSSKLNAHPELQGLQGQQPVGGQLDQASLDTLMKQFPEVYASAKAGDFLLRYKTKLIIYDYNVDKIVNAVNLG